jgi:hypothetical protein
VSSNLPVASGGGAVVSLPAGDVIPAAQGGDVYLDRGGSVRSTAQGFHGELQRAAGVAINGEQIQRVQKVLQRYRHAQDQQDWASANAAIKAKWGAATEGNLIKINGWLLDTMGKELANEIWGARDSEGTGICNKLPVLEAMLKAAQGNADVSNNGSRGSGGSAPDARQREIEIARAGADRLRELDRWMSNRDPRYWKDEAAQCEYRDLLDRGVTADGTPKTADSDLKRRIAEIEKWMSAPRGSAEYRKYYDNPATQQEYLELLDRRG